jgi:hypothetical protein
MEKIIMAKDVMGLSVGAYINKVLNGHGMESALFGSAVANGTFQTRMHLPDYWHGVYAVVNGTNGQYIQSHDGQEVLRAIHRNRKMEFGELGSWAEIVQLWAPISSGLVANLKAIIPTANDATDGKMDMWLTDTEDTVTSDTCHAIYTSGWVRMAHLLLFDKLVELHSSEFEHKLLQCYGPVFQAEDTQAICNMLASLSTLSKSRDCNRKRHRPANCGDEHRVEAENRGHRALVPRWLRSSTLQLD